MSRIGKQPIPIPDKVKVTVQEGIIRVEGPLGRLQIPLDPLLEVAMVEKVLEVKVKTLAPEASARLRGQSHSREASARHGLFRNLIRNMVEGVSQGFKRELEITGVGYRAEVKGEQLNLNLGFSHPIEFAIPDGIKVQVDKQVRLVVAGASKELVGETAARIRKFRPPEPYKGKGIRYSNEVIQRKVGKAAVASGGGK